ncbi:DMP19 family protein [Lysobacter sp. HA35]
MDNIELESLSERAFEALEAVGGDINRPSEPARTVVIVYSAQGIIDNGGLPYFFYSDFPGSPRYSVFSAAYLRIGAADAAEAIALAAKLFPFPEATCRKLSAAPSWKAAAARASSWP